MLPNYGCLLGEHPRKPGADAYSKDIFLLLKLHCIRSKRLYGYNLHIPSETLPDISRFVSAGTRSSGWDFIDMKLSLFQKFQLQTVDDVYKPVPIDNQKPV